MENLDIKDCQESKYNIEVQSETKYKLIFNVESDMKGIVKEEIKVEYPKIETDNSNQYQFIWDDELHHEMKEAVKAEEIIESTENGDVIEFKQEKDIEEYYQNSNNVSTLQDNNSGGLGYGYSQQWLQDSVGGIGMSQQMIQTNKRKDLIESRKLKYKIGEYCFMCQDFGHIMGNYCITCFNCGIKGHVRQDCPLNHHVFIKPNMDTKVSSQLRSHDRIGSGTYDSPKHSKRPKYLESIEDDRNVSDDMADACKTSCQICHKDIYLYLMRHHTLREHNLQITEYKGIYGNFSEDISMIIKPVYHKCHLCGKIILLDNDHLGGHIKGLHKMKEKYYKAQFMTRTPNKVQSIQQK